MAAPNIYQNSANWLNKAANIYSNPQLTGNPALAKSFTYNPAYMTAAQTANPNLISAGISRYMNPFTNDVINRTAADVNRAATVQRGGNAADAVAASAFGGGRHGVVDAITNSEAQKNIGDVSAQLRNQGWQAAAGLSAQDIGNQMATGQFNANLLQQARASNQGSRNAAGQYNATNKQNTSQFNANNRNAWDQQQANEALSRASGLSGTSQMGFNMGQNIGQSQANQGKTQQDLVQNLMNLASGQFQGYTGKPQDALNMFLSALGMNPMTNATKTTQSYQPGMLDWASLIGQTIAGMKSNTPVPV